MIIIDGSYGEGGGQIVRTALALAATLMVPVKVFNIRKNRPVPGLKAQHLAGLNALKELTEAYVEGDYIGSTEIEFYPKIKRKDRIIVDIGTAGSITLLLQTITLPLIRRERETYVKIIGGTDVAMSPTLDFFRYVILGNLRKIGINIDITVIKRGFYPKGGGEVEVIFHPWEKIRRYNFIELGDIKKICGSIVASKHLKSRDVAEREYRVLKDLLENQFPNVEINIWYEYVDTYSPGNSITLWIEGENSIIGADALGERGKKAEDVAKEAFMKLLKEYNAKAGVDKHTADNLVLFLAFSKGSLKTSEITNHLRTNVWVIEKFLGHVFEIDEDEKVVKAI